MKYYINYDKILHITCRSKNAPRKEACIGSATCTEDCKCCLNYNIISDKEIWIECSDIMNAMPINELKKYRKAKLDKIKLSIF